MGEEYAGRKRLTVAEAAGRLGVSERLVSLWLKQGLLRGLKPTGSRAGYVLADQVAGLLRPNFDSSDMPNYPSDFTGRDALLRHSLEHLLTVLAANDALAALPPHEVAEAVVRAGTWPLARDNPQADGLRLLGWLDAFLEHAENAVARQRREGRIVRFPTPKPE